MKKFIATIALLLASSFCYAEYDSSPDLQNLIDTNCATQNTVNLAPGKYFLYSALVIKTNCKVVGSGADFRTVLVPVGSSAFIIDGNVVTGGWAFRNLLKDFSIDGSQAGVETLIKINKTYNTKIDNLFIYDHGSPIGFDILESNDISINQLVMRGKTNSQQTGILVGDKASVFISESDIEVYSRCIKTAGNSTTSVRDTYMERCIVNVEHGATGMGYFSAFGGYWKSINGYNVQLKGSNLNLYGVKLESWNATTLDGRIVHCWQPTYTNVSLNGVAPYPGYNLGTNCEGKGIVGLGI